MGTVDWWHATRCGHLLGQIELTKQGFFFLSPFSFLFFFLISEFSQIYNYSQEDLAKFGYRQYMIIYIQILESFYIFLLSAGSWLFWRPGNLKFQFQNLADFFWRPIFSQKSFVCVQDVIFLRLKKEERPKRKMLLPT